MIFNEIYGVYYNAVSKIIKAAVEHELTTEKMHSIIEEYAYSESMLTIEPSLKEEKWQLVKPDGTTPIKYTPTMPLTNLQKRWLKAISLDPRIKLFDCDFSFLEDVEPLFTPDDYFIFDKYSDGDNFEDPEYIRNFRMILNAVKTHQPLEIVMKNRKGSVSKITAVPEYIEYSEKDDKFRLISANGSRKSHSDLTGKAALPPASNSVLKGAYLSANSSRKSHPIHRTINLGRIISCEYCGTKIYGSTPETHKNECCVTLTLCDKRNTLERAMLHFSHFKKEAVRLDEYNYKLKINYSKNDETELLIRILSFGPTVKVTEPESFVELIKERLQNQKSCGLM